MTHRQTSTADVGALSRKQLPQRAAMTSPMRSNPDSSMPNAVRFPLTAGTHAALPTGISRKDLLVDMVADAMRQMRAAASGLTRPEQDRMKQFSNGQYLSGVLSIVEIGQKCEDLAAATAFAEALRGFTVTHHPKANVDVLEAFGAETHANGLANDAQHDFWQNPTPANLDRAVEMLNRQLVETHRSLVALHRARQVNRSLRA